MDKNSIAPIPPKLLQITRDVKNDAITDELKQKLKAFCDIFTYVRLDDGDVPVLKPNLGFRAGSECEEFMDFDYLTESAGLRKYVRTRFGDETFTSEYVAVTVIRPGVRARESATLYNLDRN